MIVKRDASIYQAPIRGAAHPAHAPPPIFRAMNIFSCKARSEVPGNRIYDVEFSNFPGGISCQAVRGFVNPGSGPVYICMISWAEPMVHLIVICIYNHVL